MPKARACTYISIDIHLKINNRGLGTTAGPVTVPTLLNLGAQDAGLGHVPAPAALRHEPAAVHCQAQEITLAVSIGAQPLHRRVPPRRRRPPAAPHPFPLPTQIPAGIVQGKAQVQSIDAKPDFRSFEIAFPPGAADGVAIGASVAINGTCLTVVAQSGDVLRFDVIGETLKRTNLGALAPGSPVNYERSARVGDEIGGHTVSGHVHTTATIVDAQQTADNLRLEFELGDPGWAKYILPKGFVAVDGCSLTVGEVTPRSFSVYLIPETLRVTVLGDKGPGDVVNVEAEAQTQAIVDTVERVVEKYLAERGIAAGGGGK